MPSLQILKGPNEGQIIPLDGDRFVMGRNPDCGIVIPDTGVSREHAQIVRKAGKFFIEDRQSRNGTFVNNQLINTRKALKNNDRIRICDFVACFLHQSTAAEPPAKLLPGFASVSPRTASLEAECRAIREKLEVNHVLYEHAEVLGLHEAVADPSSSVRRILGVGFHRLVVLDAEWGKAG